jgi:hypothetical protein
MKATLSHITLEHLDAPGGPLQATISTDGLTCFVRDTIAVYGPRGPYPTKGWVESYRTGWGFPKTTQQMMDLASSMERMGWKEIGRAWSGLPSAGRIEE